MAVTVIKQFVGTIRAGNTMFWTMTGVHPPFNKNLRDTAQPDWLVEWQAIPLVVTVPTEAIGDPLMPTAKAGFHITHVTVVLEPDTSLTHIVPITCFDAGNPPPGANFIATYVLYAIFTDRP